MLAKDRARILRRWADLMLENEDGLARLLTTEQGKPLAESRAEIAYAASFYEWFGEEGKRVYGDTIPTYAADRRIVVTKDPIGVTVGNHAVELPRRDAHAQVRARARGRLHDGAEAGRADAAVRARDRAARPRGGPAGRRLPDRHRRGRGRTADRRRDDVEPHRAQARLHRLDGGREAADGAVREAGQEGVARARRQRAVHRLRRRRPRRGARGRADLQVPQQRADVHLREPHLRAGRDLRRVRVAARRCGVEAEGRERSRARDERRPADRAVRDRQGASATSATRSSAAAR